VELDKYKIGVINIAKFDDCKSIGKQLKSNINIIINTSDLSKEMTERVVDFLCGIIYALDGTCLKIRKDIYIFATKDTVATKPEGSLNTYGKDIWDRFGNY
jgi:cell division inhibitor SepF